ncbi:hypothetical protein F4809DRAFT_172745 [Biscogniauxia mediterranea]|nr:hypothetical protein F4809DRAFT_172745 [Biscogniauxia mediterranea]
MADLINLNQEAIAGPSHANPTQNQSVPSQSTYTLVKQHDFCKFEPGSADFFVLVVVLEMEDKYTGSSFFAYQERPPPGIQDDKVSTPEEEDTRHHQTWLVNPRQMIERTLENKTMLAKFRPNHGPGDLERGEGGHCSSHPPPSTNVESTEENDHPAPSQEPATPPIGKGKDLVTPGETPVSGCWLPAISLDDPVHLVGFSLDLSSGKFNFDAAAMHVLSRIARYFESTRLSVHPSIIFLSHGYGSVLVPRILGYDKDSMQKTPDEWRAVQETLKLSTAAVINFASPLLTSRTKIFVEWAAERLKLPIEDSTPLFKVKFEKYRPFQKFTAERNIQLLDFWHRPLSRKAIQFESKEQDDISTIAKFIGHADSELKYLFSLMQKAVSSHRILKAAAFGDCDTMDTITRHGIDLKPLDYHGRTALHLAVLRQDIEMVKKLTESQQVRYLVTKKDKKGDTALHIVIRLESPSNQDDVGTIVEMLIQHGARPDEENLAGQTPLDIALDQSSQIARLLETRQKVRDPSLKIMSKSKPPGTYGLQACKDTKIVITVFGAREGGTYTSRKLETVYELLYGEKSFEDIICSLDSGNSTSSWKCRWIHIPMNNMAWVNDLFIQVNREHIWPWLSNIREGRFPHGRCMPPKIGRLGNSNEDSPKILALTMPYISYQKFSTQKKYNSVLLNLSRSNQDLGLQDTYNEQGDLEGETSSDETTSCAETPTTTASRNRQVQDKDDTQDTLPDGIECSLTAYLNYRHSTVDLPLHPRRTLDQSYYYMLEDTSYRDETQVVSRWNHNRNPQKIRGGGEHGAAHNILMVDQLWLWNIPREDDQEHSTIITCFPSREGAVLSCHDDLRSTILSQSDKEPISNDNELVTRIIATCIDVFGHNNQDESLHFFKFFQSAIGHTEEEIVWLFKRFREYADRLCRLNENNPEYQKRRSQYLKELLDISRESNLLEDVKDILDEIKMIQCILDDQKEVISKVKTFLKPKGRKLRNILRNTLEETEAKFKTMQDHARSVEASLTQLFDLKQKQANLWEARSSREEVEETARQGHTLMVFTVVTIIFLPPSFMSSFFAISVAQFPHDQSSGEVSWPLSYLSGLLFGISFAIVILILLCAFNIQWLTGPWNDFRQVSLRHRMLGFLRLLKYFRGICGIATWGNKWEKHIVRDLIKYIMVYKIDDDLINPLNHIIEESWGCIATNISRTGTDGLHHSMDRGGYREHITALLARSVQVDDDSSDGSEDDKVKRPRAYEQLKKVLIRYFDEEELQTALESLLP